MPEKYTKLTKDEVEGKFNELIRVSSNAASVLKEMLSVGLESAYFSWTPADDQRVAVLGKTIALCRAMIDEQVVGYFENCAR